MKKEIYCNKCGTFIGWLTIGSIAETIDKVYKELTLVCPKCNRVVGPSETKEGGN